MSHDQHLPHDEQLAIYRKRLNENSPRGRRLRNAKRRRERDAKIKRPA